MKAAIPALMTGTPDIDRHAEAVKQNLDSITGQQKNSVPLTALASTATTAQIITQLNAILARIQG